MWKLLLDSIENRHFSLNCPVRVLGDIVRHLVSIELFAFKKTMIKGNNYLYSCRNCIDENFQLFSHILELDKQTHCP